MPTEWVVDQIVSNPSPGHTLIAGDLNAHYPEWNSHDEEEDRGRRIIEVMGLLDL
jgi:hypothetical protein